MEFSDVVRLRRSCRIYTDEKVPSSVIESALKDAILAPNSSNLQLMKFYWVQNPEKRKKLIEACLNQSAARTSQELIVVASNWSYWQSNCKKLISDFVTEQKNPALDTYYKKLIPISYTYGFFNIIGLIKWILFTFIGFFRPMMRGPITRGDVAMVSVKSAALACENFMLSIYNQGFSCCPMEGFDELRVKRIIGESIFSSKVVMVISVGKADARGIQNPQFRFPYDHFVEKL